jgi:hypothetical protein
LAWRPLACFPRLRSVNHTFSISEHDTSDFVILCYNRPREMSCAVLEAAQDDHFATEADYSQEIDRIMDYIPNLNPRLFTCCKLYHMTALEAFRRRQRIRFTTKYTPKTPIVVESIAECIEVAEMLEKKLAFNSMKPQGCNFLHPIHVYRNKHGLWLGSAQDMERRDEIKALVAADWDRLMVILYLCFHYALWLLVKQVPSYFGTYRVPLQWALIGFCLGTKKWSLLTMLVAIIDLLLHPIARLRSIYEHEKDLHRNSIRLHKYTREIGTWRLGRTIAFALPAFMILVAVLEIACFCYRDVSFTAKGGIFAAYLMLCGADCIGTPNQLF